MSTFFIFKITLTTTCFIHLISCSSSTSNDVFVSTNTRLSNQDTISQFIIYTDSSFAENEYLGFNSSKAINQIAGIENEYFNNYNKMASKYYGTIWYSFASCDFSSVDSISTFDKYKSELNKINIEPDSMHCTIYAMKALKEGLDTNFVSFEKKHKQIWQEREYAGWSVAYILTKYFGWEAFLIISESSPEYQKCIDNYNRDKKYHVWRQPNIPLQNYYDFNLEKQAIDSLLSLHEFGWGFSYQGWHTWITRYNTLKECIWTGCPSRNYVCYNSIPLFTQIKFTEFTAYDSHVIVFPPKKKR